MATILTAEQCAAIRERAEKATAGPWQYEQRDLPDDIYMLLSDEDYTIAETAMEPLANFIAAARTDIPALLDTVEELRKQLGFAIDRQHREWSEIEPDGGHHYWFR